MTRQLIRAGKIYVLRNEHMRELMVKVGKTLRTSEERARELDKATGVAGTFEVMFEEDVADVDYAERLVHERLASYRLQPNREFFRVPYKLAIRAVFDTCTEVNKDLAAKITRVRILLDGTADGRRLQELLSPHRGGNVKVVVYYENEEAACEVDLGDQWRVVFSPTLVWELQTWLGTEGVLFA